MNLKYNISPYFYKRFPTREVKVGQVGIGGTNPIRIQSMTTSDTQDTKSTVQQILDLEAVGCEIVRLTVPSLKDAENLSNIRKELKAHGSKVPLVADIHFTPSVAMKAVEYVEKIRINPGNFVDKKKFIVKEYTDVEYQAELDKIAEAFIPLVRRCKELGVAMRIGTNHGSLSDRIMNRYGDTPMGMVESALEFIRIAEAEGYHEIVVSMKASNPQIMVYAYRLLVSRFIELGMNYPIHLGVTEAGDGKDGRIKSAIGIGSLLEDGIGDTIRVSLTEDAVHEIPVAKKLVEKYNNYKEQTTKEEIILREFRNPYEYNRFYSSAVSIGELKVGESYPVRVETCFPILSHSEDTKVAIFEFYKKEQNVKPEILHFAPQDENELQLILQIKKEIQKAIPFSVSLERLEARHLFNFPEIFSNIDKLVFPFRWILENKNKFLKFTKEWNPSNLKSIELVLQPHEILNLHDELNYFQKEKISRILFSLRSKDFVHDYRKLALNLSNYDYPILLLDSFENLEEALYGSSIGMGSLLVDGIGDVIRIEVTNSKPQEKLELSFDILQAARLRTVKTEFISCPSCGRTLFDLQETTARIKSKTSHLKGLKIAIMGCIVNGPGEMADADFGYVGAGPGKVHLYKGKEIVMKSVPSEIADEKLVELIKQEGKWIDP
jgi:(E)-4-hydroxy-3-methylbut-2-enyl-diphosphate synthase